MMRKTMLGACAGAALTLAGLSATAATTFETDVNTAINRGLEYLNSAGAFSGYPTCTGSFYQKRVRGLALLALLEKRATGNLNDPPQGYAGASDVDKTRMRKAVACILDDVNEQGEEAYYYGNWLMGLALYSRTGGPGKGAADIPDDADLIGLGDAINKMTDDLLGAQCPATGTASIRGMWSYTGCGGDSSTTQFAAAGLAGAKAYYIAKGDPGTRLPGINAALALARQHYADFGSTAGSDDSTTCDRIEETEKGHGYYATYNPSLQQTSSGLWLQLLGGATVNDAGVQAYLRWMRNHYRWQNLGNMGNSWPGNSYWYYMWSSMKGLLTIKEGNVTLAPGNLGADSFGLLGPTADPDTSDTLAGTCPARQLHRDPAAAGIRPPSYGTGTYVGTAQSTYFDYATAIMGYDCGDGNFSCNGAPSSWYANPWDRNAWALLVLQRATGGACVDADEDGECDGGGDEGAPILLCDANFDGNITMSDLNAVYAIVKSKYPVAAPVTPENAWANYNTSGASASTIDINDFWQCYYVGRGMLPKKYSDVD